MIYFLHSDGGKDGAQAAAKKAASLASDLLKKKPDASLFSLTEENWNESAIDEYTGGQGLFSNKYIVLVRGILDATGTAAAKKELKESFLEKLEVFAESPNIFIISAGSIDKGSLKKIEKHAEKVQEVPSGDLAIGADGKKTTGKSGGFGGGSSMFAMADALGARDKKTLWILYREAIEEGKVPEEIHGILFWQAKCMVIAAKTKSAGESGLNPFVYQKSKRYAENFNPAELADLLARLVSVYHDSHRGIHEFETAMERMVLEY
jgi:DNA polymerase III delta subunit